MSLSDPLLRIADLSFIYGYINEIRNVAGKVRFLINGINKQTTIKFKQDIRRFIGSPD